MPQKSKGTNTFSSYLAPFYNAHYLYSCSLTIFWYICMMCFLTRCLTFDRKFIESFNLIWKYQATGMLSIVCLSAQVLAKIIHSSKRQWYCCNKCLQNVQHTLAAQSIFYTYIIKNTSNHTVRNKKKITSANRALWRMCDILQQFLFAPKSKSRVSQCIQLCNTLYIYVNSVAVKCTLHENS